MTIDLRDIGIVDGKVQNYITPDNVLIPTELLRDADSRERGQGRQVTKYLFKEVGTGTRTSAASSPAGVVAELDRWGISVAQLDVGVHDAGKLCAELAPWANRFVVSVRLNPHAGLSELRELQRQVEQHDMIRSACLYPLTTWPPIPANAKECYPIYAKCAELGLPIFVTVGIPGPRVPSHTQHPMALDEVCWFFPELTVVMMHGGEPWVDLCVKLLLKWPNLHFMTSGFAPKHYPEQIIHLLNTRGTGKILYGGYWPTLSFDRIMTELADLPLREEVRRPFFSENARRLLGIGEPA